MAVGNERVMQQIWKVARVVFPCWIVSMSSPFPLSCPKLCTNFYKLLFVQIFLPHCMHVFLVPTQYLVSSYTPGYEQWNGYKWYKQYTVVLVIFATCIKRKLKFVLFWLLVVRLPAFLTTDLCCLYSHANCPQIGLIAFCLRSMRCKDH